MSDPAGRLNIQLRRTPGGLACRVRSTRPVTASSMFAGRSVAETSRLLPMLYSICAKAQACACVGALEAALGLRAPASVWRLRHLTVRLETVREHLWRMLLDWPRFGAEQPDRAGMSAVLARVKALFALADPSGALFRPGAEDVEWVLEAWSPALAELEKLAVDLVFGQPIDAWLDRVVDAHALERWAATTDTAPARLIRALVASDEAAMGRSEITPLPELDSGVLAARLIAPDGADFIAQPCWGGVPRETSPWTRNRDRALIRALATTHGNAILPRLAAQLLEVACLISAAHAGSSSFPAESGESTLIAPATGLGRVEAARGHLTHLARVRGEGVLDYRILAPTEWNFHPAGALVKALAGLSDAPDRQLARRAELLIMAVDPCVAYDLELKPTG